MAPSVLAEVAHLTITQAAVVQTRMLVVVSEHMVHISHQVSTQALSL